MSLLAPESENKTTAGGLSRRRILQGMAWAAPAVIIATAAPAAAASEAPGPRTDPPAPLPTGTGMTVESFGTDYQANRWNETVGGKLKAVNAQLYVQNKGNSAPNSASVILIVMVPVGTLQNPRWGIGNGNGIAPGEPWTLASGPTVTNHVATITLVYTGAPLGPWGGVSVSNLWVETSGNVAGQTATASINATYQGNFSSFHSASDAV